MDFTILEGFDRGGDSEVHKNKKKEKENHFHGILLNRGDGDGIGGVIVVIWKGL